MSAMALTALLTTAPPFSAWSRAAMASWFAWPALSAFCLTVVVISSIEEAVSSSEEDCSSVRCERLALPAEISSAPRCTSAATPFTLRDDLRHVVGELVDSAAHRLEEAALAGEIDALAPGRRR